MRPYERDEEAWRLQNAENAARLAIVRVMFDSAGWGEFQAPEIFDFGIRFLEEPCVAYGCAIDGDALVPLRYPRCTGGVYRWATDIKGYYTGAWCFFVVDTLSPANIANVPTEDPNYDINHYFTFSGVALKQLNDDFLDL